MTEMLKMIVCEPGQAPEVRTAEKLDLDAMQSIVGGVIEMVMMGDGVDLYFHGESRIRHLPFNRYVPDVTGQQWDILGPLFLVSHDGDGGTVGLTDEQVEEWLPKLALPKVKVPQVEPGLVAVFHAQHPNFAGSYMWDIQPPPPWPQDFEQVAWVIVGDRDENGALNMAWQLTNHIDSAWTDNDGVKALTRRPRSSAVGDVFLLADGRVMRVDSCGFVEVKNGS